MRKAHCIPWTSYGFVEEGISSLVSRLDPAQGSLTSSWPVRNQAAQQEVSGRVSEKRHQDGEQRSEERAGWCTLLLLPAPLMD